MRGSIARAAAARWCGLVAIGLATSLVPPAIAAGPAAPTAQLKDNLYGTKFVDQQRGWVVGAFGVVYRTSDGGKTWTAQPTKTTQQLYDVDFVDADHGWIVGRSGTILATRDGGTTWTAQQAPVDNHLFSVDFADDRHGVIAGDWGTILVTKDGGATWEKHSLEDDIILNDVSMVDASRGWVAGELGTIMTTQDGGQTWTKQETGIDKTLYGVFFADAQNGWVVGMDALILHTADGGQTWKLQNGSTEIRELEQVGFASAYETPSLYAVQVVGPVGIAIGEIGSVFMSADAGQTWKRVETSDAESRPKWFRALSIVKGTYGAIVGADGERLRVVNGRVEQPDGGTGAAETVH